MAINPALLIASPTFQDYFVDKTTGTALAAGIVTMYRDNSRTTLKNWYYQSGVPGAYTYVTLPNPMTLSAVGTIVDPYGNDTIPFFYPYDEDDETVLQPYYVVVTDSNLEVQFTRQNFPYLPQGSSSTEVPIYNNIISNNVFWHNVGTLNATDVTNAIIAPSQHDSLSAASNSDIRFIKSATGASDTITFTQFGLNNDPFLPEPTPEYYLNFNCTAAQAGETLKCIQVPLSLHIKTLESISATVTIWAQNVAGNANNMLTLSITQFLGSGAIATSPVIPLTTLTLSDSWVKYMLNFTFPSGSGLTLGTGGDDALFLNIGLPLALTCNINFTKPSVFLSETIPTNEFQTYDQIDTIINSPRTGDVRVSLNSFYPFGWVLMNDGTIGNASSNATTRANIDTWNLFYLLWNSVGATYAPMFTSAGSPTSYGASAIADWNANNQISLTKQLGRFLASAGIPSSGTNTGTDWALGQITGNEEVTLASGNLPAHTHAAPVGSGGQYICTGSGGSVVIGNGGSTVTTFEGSSTGNNTTANTAVNVINPASRFNIIMKL